MMLWRHPDFDSVCTLEYLMRRAALPNGPVPEEEAIEDAEIDGFERIWPEDPMWAELGLVSGSDALLPIFETIADGVTSLAAATTKRSVTRVESPYFTKEEAAEYLRTTVDGIYGRVERGQLQRCPGTREYLFTKEMLDDSAMGRVQKPARRRKPR